MGRPLRAVSWLCSGISCSGDDEYMLINNRAPGSGIYPTGPCVIHGIALRTWLNSAGAYAVLGKTQPFGDYVTPRLWGPNFWSENFGENGFPWDAPQTLPVTAGDGTDQLHLHYLAQTSEANPQLELTVWYSLDSDSDI